MVTQIKRAKMVGTKNSLYEDRKIKAPKKLSKNWAGKMKNMVSSPSEINKEQKRISPIKKDVSTMKPREDKKRR